MYRNRINRIRGLNDEFLKERGDYRNGSELEQKGEAGNRYHFRHAEVEMSLIYPRSDL